MRDLAERVGASCGYMMQAFRGSKRAGACGVGSRGTSRSRPGQNRRRLPRCRVSRNEAARRAGISSGQLSQIVNGLRDPSPGVLKRLHGVLFRKARSEARVVPAEVKVLGGRRGVVVRGAGSGRRFDQGRRPCSLGC